MRNTYILLFSLYWAQGLPVGFMTHALPVILRAEGVSLAHIGGFGLLMLPWSIKIFWAPWVDRHGSIAKGHYRSWIIPLQWLSVAVLIGLSFLPIQALNQPLYLLLFFITLLLMNGIGATQDIATDALAVNILKNEQQYWGNTFQVIGSRLGFIVGGGAILWLLDLLQWQATFLLLAALVFLNTLPILLFKEPDHLKTTTQTSEQPALSNIKTYFQYFWSDSTLAVWLLVLLTFKIADGLSGPLLKPLMVDLGLSFSQIGLYVTMLGALAALIGAGLAGWCLKYWSRSRSLLIFSVLKIMTLMAYAWLAAQYETQKKVENWMIYLINAAEDMISAMLLVVMLTLVMQYSRKHLAGTDFTFQVALMATVSGGLYSLSGILGDALGYQNYLNLIVIVAIICLIPIFRWMKVAEKV
ncbi:MULTISPECIES: MFS transporter [Acinetobacter]|uniref:MFS family permease n=1 Tax=Acinetobacter lwoffii TaxID=28090 RepID=A0AAW3VCU8_ACILW|nr:MULTISPECIES: MFS transporter [Acinetobacter]KGH47094.1 MFS transporter [Acinetobacter idrijaensis]MBB6362314.1 MFS family permease [Acinetobacter lwoffii]MEB6678608.1 MFS transporter [Acinetobacter lwoffii]OIU86014.1 MFS transporter [Acinetobacter sp. AR2-3]QZM12969.1 AmpG permease [Acinetobacter lwoffii]